MAISLGPFLFGRRAASGERPARHRVEPGCTCWHLQAEQNCEAVLPCYSRSARLTSASSSRSNACQGESVAERPLKQQWELLRACASITAIATFAAADAPLENLGDSDDRDSKRPV